MQTFRLATTLLSSLLFVILISGIEAGRPRGTAHPLVVGVDRSADLALIAARVEAHGYELRRLLPDLHALEVTGTGDLAAEARVLSALPGVRYAEPVASVYAADAPSDPYFGRQSSYLSVVNAPAAWDIEQGKSDIIVAVIDTGVNILHPDLQANIWRNPGEIANNGVDDDGNLCVDDLNGCAFVSDSSPGCQNVTNGFIHDDIGHGTFVAGVIAAAANNGTGIVGVARGVRIMPVKVLDCYGAGDSVATARGILYAAHSGAKIINMSLGGYEDSQTVRDAVSEASRLYGALSVAASGNAGTLGVAFPAKIPEVLAVGAASAGGGSRAAFSSYGPEVDVVAVGEGIIGPVPQSACNKILACFFGEPYATGSGTSFSTPQVAGLAALLLSVNRGLTPAQLTDIIKGSATPLPPGNTPGWAGAGRVNMLAAVRAAQSNLPPGDPCVIEFVIDGDTFTCVGGRQVRMLQIDAPDLGQCGGQWAFDALRYIFLTPGRAVSLQYDATRTDTSGRTLAVPIWRGSDGADYNLSIIMAYVGLARAADVGAGNVAYRDWAFASQNWASVAQWNMWAPGKTFNGGC